MDSYKSQFLIGAVQQGGKRKMMNLLTVSIPYRRGTTLYKLDEDDYFLDYVSIPYRRGTTAIFYA